MWSINNGPAPGPHENRDARSWRWEIERDGVTRRLLIEVTGPAELDPRPEVQQVIESQGRTAVESVIDRGDPPGRITFTQEGRLEEPYRSGR